MIELRKVHNMSRETHAYENDTAFIRVDSDNIVGGLIDIQSAKSIIEGTQEVVSYFLQKEDSDLARAKDINYPIATREGCWEVIVPFGTFVAGAVAGSFGKGLDAYATATGKRLGELQFEKKESREIFESAFKKLDVVVKISQHLGVVDRKAPLNIKIVDYDKKSTLLTNDQGNVMSTTMDEIEIYTACPPRLLHSLASVVTDYRTVSIGYVSGNVFQESVIDIDSKEVFAPEEEPYEPVLPELHNGEQVTLRGYVSRGNQITNTIGFKYKDHVITCYPYNKLITGYLNAHYRLCDITGVVQRTSPGEVALGKRDRPKIVFDSLVVVKDEGQQQQSLLNGEA